MESLPTLPADPGLRLMVILATAGIASLCIGLLRGLIQKDTHTAKATGLPLLMLAATLAGGKVLQGLHVYLMASIALLAVGLAFRLGGINRILSLSGAICLLAAFGCALWLF